MWRQTALSVALRHPVEPSRNKLCVLTGASSGIGLSCAVALSKAGWRVICAVRNTSKMAEIIAKTGPIGPGQLEIMELDLSSFESVKRFASALLAREDVPVIDVLLLNAGLGMQWALTKDGYEQGFQTCHLSHHLLTRLLEDKLIASAPSRIVVVASHAHKSSSRIYDWPMEGHRGFRSDSSKGFSVPFQYAQSKLANMHFALVAGERLREKNVTVLSLHPGVIDSNLWPRWMIGRSLYMLNTAQGAATSVFLASDPRFEITKDVPVGTYWCPSRVGLPHQETPTRLAMDHVIAKRLWEETEKIIAPFL